ncbi:MAG: hypothetical protein LBK61_05230 [Spirochaetaceae bacterium]|jgi:hypothetical protein|nr:hypothetical protein [Spirochaetaceae bacterium]
MRYFHNNVSYKEKSNSYLYYTTLSAKRQHFLQKTRRVFIPLRTYPRFRLKISGGRARYAAAALPLRNAPAGGENPSGFHPIVIPLVKPTPVLAEESAAGRQNTVMWRLCFPCGCAMPPHGGILPAVTMPDRGGMNT